MNNEANLTPETAIANLQQKEDLGLRYYAAWWLGKFRVKTNLAVETLIDALTDEEDRAPDGGFPLRRNAAKALGKLGYPQAVEPLISCLTCDDYYVRESAAQALEMICDPRAIVSLVALLEDSVKDGQLTDYAFQTIPGKPHLNQPYEAILEALGTLNAQNAIDLIKPFVEHSTPKVSYGAARAMYQLTREDQYGDLLIIALDGEELQLRRSALMDLGAVGYIKSAEAISETLAENSLKLIAMKGLLETQVQKDQAQQQDLSPESVKLMSLMDDLL